MISYESLTKEQINMNAKHHKTAPSEIKTSGILVLTRQNGSDATHLHIVLSYDTLHIQPISPAKYGHIFYSFNGFHT